MSPRIRGDHAHFSDHIIDPETDAPIGVTQIVRLLGPFNVTATTPVGDGVFGDGGLYIDCFNLPDGSIVFQCWAEIASGFASGSQIFFAVGSAGDTGGSLSTDLQTNVKAAGTEVADANPDVYSEAGHPGLYSSAYQPIRQVRAVSGAVFQAYYGGDVTAVGEANIYALIAGPVE